MLNSGLSFDHYQFENLKALPVSTETEIDFADYRRMHSSVHVGNHSQCPPFAQNDHQMQKVLLARAWFYVYFHSPFPENLNREELDRLATYKALAGHKIRRTAAANQHAALESLRESVRHAGSFMARDAGVAYRSWRLLQDSVTVAAAMRMTPWAVRQTLHRIKYEAVQLGFDIGPTRGTFEPRKFQNRTTQPQVLAKSLQPKFIAPVNTKAGTYLKRPTDKTVDRHVRILRELARRYGFIPPVKWLTKNGYFYSYEIMRTVPEAFADLSRGFISRS